MADEKEKQDAKPEAGKKREAPQKDAPKKEEAVKDAPKKGGESKEDAGKSKKKEAAEKPVKKEAPKDQIKDRVRVSGVILDGSKPLDRALTSIKGVGPQIARTLSARLPHDKHTKLRDLDEKQISELEKILENLHSQLPTFMLNRQNDKSAGGSVHLIGPELEMANREDLNREKKSRSYRGVRHSLNLRVRGQRTRTTGRKGTTLGVTRKKTAQPSQQKDKK